MKILVTGGAGFIGSNLCEALLQQKQIIRVRVLDNLATGLHKNIEHLLSDPKFEFINGDIRDYETCKAAAAGMDCISHQAALGSVPRSINDPVTTNAVNISGTLNIFQAARENGIKRVIYAASSSTYGDSESLPKIEERIGKPLSPYAITKYVNELYADVFHRLYGIDFIGLRYFNVFGPKQNPEGPYAAVIPLFINAALSGETTYINGDGEQSRDFTFVANAVEANIKALFTDNADALNQVFNVAFGEKHTVNQLFDIVKEICNNPAFNKVHRGSREGDVKHSLADISKAKKMLHYDPEYDFKKGLKQAFDWYSNNQGYFS